jgi:hypothetical protein
VDGGHFEVAATARIRNDRLKGPAEEWAPLQSTAWSFDQTVSDDVEPQHLCARRVAKGGNLARFLDQGSSIRPINSG